MINRVKIKGKSIASVFVLLSLILIAVPSNLMGQPATHKVQRGETLWSICEKYYGDAFLWPKLWEMNPFVTNPHLLKPGDLITLIKKEDMDKKKPLPISSQEGKPIPKMKGVDLTLMTNPLTMGYLSVTRVESWGEIYGTTKSELGAEKGDKIFLNMSRADVKPGDELRVAKAIPVWHPIAQRLPLDPPFGNVISFRGRVVIKQLLQDTYYLAEVTDVFAEFGVGAMVFPIEPMAACVQPLSTDPKLYGTIVAGKDNRRVISKNSVVYLDSGFKDGIQRGQVFDIVRIHKIPRGENLKVGTFEELVDDSFASGFSKEKYLADLWTKLTQGDVTYYEISVGKLMVVESRPNSATAVVLSSTDEIMTGAFIKGFSWSDVPEFLTNLPICPLE